MVDVKEQVEMLEKEAIAAFVYVAGIVASSVDQDLRAIIVKRNTGNPLRRHGPPDS